MSYTLESKTAHYKWRESHKEQYKKYVRDGAKKHYENNKNLVREKALNRYYVNKELKEFMNILL